MTDRHADRPIPPDGSPVTAAAPGGASSRGMPYWACVLAGLALPVAVTKLYVLARRAGLCGYGAVDPFTEATFVAYGLPVVCLLCAAALAFSEWRVRAFLGRTFTV